MNNAFIIGTGRCGTTYLAQILNAHSKICVPPEMQCVFEYDGNGSRFFENFAMGVEFDSKSAADLIERSCPHDLLRFFDYRAYCEGLRYPLSSMEAFFSGLYSAIAKSHGKEALIEQTPWYGQRLDIMTRVFPKAKYIHVVRDGRDVALSFARTPWWFKKVELNLARWANEIKKIATDAAVFLDTESYLIVRYEDLVANPDAEVARICSFLSVDPERNQLNAADYIDYDSYCKFDMSNLSSEAYLDWKKNKGSSSFKNSAYAWKNDNSGIFDSLPLSVQLSLEYYSYNISEAKSRPVIQSSSNFNVKQYISELENEFVRQKNTIDDQSFHIRSVETELLMRVNHIAAIEHELLSRGEHIAGLTQTIDDQASHICSLNTEMTRRAERTAGLETDINARGEHIAGLDRTVKDQANHIHNLNAELLARAERLSLFEKELTSRGEHIAGLDRTVKDQANHIHNLDAELLARAERLSLFEKEVAARGEHIAGLEGTIKDQANHVSSLDVELLCRAERTQEFEKAMLAQEDRMRGLNSQVFTQQSVIDELSSEIGRLKEALDESNSSWCNKFSVFRAKFQK